MHLLRNVRRFLTQAFWWKITDLNRPLTQCEPLKLYGTLVQNSDYSGGSDISAYGKADKGA